MADRSIRLRGVAVHNLKQIDLDIPLGKLIVICGLSGSGKTSLALDTLYAEGQRRYIESFSAYDRQFLDRLEKPDAERIESIPPAIAVTHKNSQRTSRSTVGTATETIDYLRLLYARIGEVFCRSAASAVPRTRRSRWRTHRVTAERASRSGCVFAEHRAASENDCLFARRGFCAARRRWADDQHFSIRRRPAADDWQRARSRCR